MNTDKFGVPDFEAHPHSSSSPKKHARWFSILRIMEDALAEG